MIITATEVIWRQSLYKAQLLRISEIIKREIVSPAAARMFQI